MSATTDPEEMCPEHAPSRSRTTGGDDTFLVRIPASDDSWVERLPPAPRSREVTVSLTDPAAAIRLAARLSDMGYVPVGAVGAGTDRAWAHVVAPRETMEAYRDWRDRLLTDGCSVYASAHGPVAMLFGGILAAHAREAS